MQRLGIDPKSLIIGLLGGVCVMLLLGAEGRQHPQGAAAPQAPAAPLSPRYQISTVECGSIYLLDHKTNEVFLIQGWEGVPWHAEVGFKIPEDLPASLKQTELQREKPDPSGL